MKNLFRLIFLSILLFQFSNCKPEGKGKLMAITSRGAFPAPLRIVEQKTAA